MHKSTINSDQLLAFLTTMRTGNTLAAARFLRLDHSTVSRRITALEDALGARLFDRSPRGSAPTAAAERLLEYAERVETALLLASSIDTGEHAISGTVRLATTEVFGTQIVAPAISELYALYPDLSLELVPQSRTISLSKREADIAITVHRPPRGRLIARKLVDYRLGLYGSDRYLSTAPPIAKITDLANHNFVSYVDDLIDDPELLALNRLRLGGHIVFRSSSSFAQQAAVANGVGLGLLHGFAADPDARLIPVFPKEIEARRSYWLVMHADLSQIPRVRAVADFIGKLVHGRSAEFLGDI